MSEQKNKTKKTNEGKQMSNVLEIMGFTLIVLTLGLLIEGETALRINEMAFMGLALLLIGTILKLVRKRKKDLNLVAGLTTIPDKT